MFGLPTPDRVGVGVRGLMLMAAAITYGSVAVAQEAPGNGTAPPPPPHEEESGVYSPIIYLEEIRGQLRLNPFISTGVSYTDNVDFDDEPKEDFVYFIRPGIELTLDSRRFQTSLNYALSFEYSTDEEGIVVEQLSTSRLESINTFQVVEDIFFVDARAIVSQELVNAESRPSASETNRGDDLATVQRYSVGPIVRYRFGRSVDNETRASIGYVTSSDDDDDNAVIYGASTEFSSGPMFNRFRWSVASRYVLQDSTEDDDQFERFTNEVNTSSQIDRTLAFLANTGYDDVDDTANEDVPDGFFWNVGFDWRPSPRLTAIATFGQRFENRDLGLNIDYEIRPGANFTARFQQTLETDGLRFQRELADFVINDPVPQGGTLGTSDDTYLRNRFDSALTVERRRNSVALVGFYETREFQTTPSTTEQTFGGSATWSRQLNRRTSASLGFEYELTEFEDMDDRVDDLYTVRTSVSHNLGDGFSVLLRYIFQHQESTDESENATENFILLSLTKRF